MCIFKQRIAPDNEISGTNMANLIPPRAQELRIAQSSEVRRFNNFRKILGKMTCEAFVCHVGGPVATVAAVRDSAMMLTETLCSQCTFS